MVSMPLWSFLVANTAGKLEFKILAINIALNEIYLVAETLISGSKID
jgi:hypothetical protein